MNFAVIAANLTILAIVVSIGVSAIRLLRGPSLADRIVSLDLISMLLVAFLVLFSATSGVEAYLDAALVLALVAFLATVAFARFVDRVTERDEAQDE